MPLEWTSGRTLTGLFGERAQNATRDLVYELAEAAAERMRDLAREFTPKDSGELASQWEVTPVRVGVQDALVVYEATVFNESPIAHLIEYGTDPHVIEGGQSFTDPASGQRVFVHEIEHPGTRGIFMLINAAAWVEADLERLLGPLVRRWAVRIERGR